jgi:hypothetical protein
MDTVQKSLKKKSFKRRRKIKERGSKATRRLHKGLIVINFQK